MLSGLTGIIGSMPHREPGEALAALERTRPTLPGWPQLPCRTFLESMVPQFSESFPGIHIDEDGKRIEVVRGGDFLDGMAAFYENVVQENVDAFETTARYAAGLHGFLEHRGAPSDKLPVVKGHLTGPFTFGLGLSDTDRKAVWFDPEYRDVVLKGLGMKALWQVRRLSRVAEKVVIFIDEPILSALGTPAYMGIEDEDVIAGLNEIVTLIHGAGAMAGVHCCGNMDWGVLAGTDVDVISFDAFFYGDKVALYPERIGEFLNRGGFLAWGIVPTSDAGVLAQMTGDELRRKTDDLTGHFVVKGLAEDTIRSQRLFTPSCGMGNLTPEQAEKVLRLLGDLREYR